MLVTRRERYVPKRPNQAWSMDFVSDQRVNGQRIRALTVVDVFTREALAASVGYRLRADDVVERSVIGWLRSTAPQCASSLTTAANSPGGCLICGPTITRSASTSAA
jgi:transposase InsO family protein